MVNKTDHEKTQESDVKSSEILMPHKGGKSLVVGLAAVVVALLVVAGAFAIGILSFGSNESVTLIGSGATFPMPLILKWASEYYNETDQRVKVSYGGGGSGTGITQIKDNLVDFAGTDAPLDAATITEYGLVHIPETIGAIVAAYNIPGVSELRLDGEALARIFMHDITTWDDPAIVALNPGVTLPPESIVTVARSDSSGTTFVFTGYLSIVSDDWNAEYGQGKTITWPEGTLGASGNPGVTSLVQSTEFSIGYIELNYALQNNLKFATLRNHDGQWVEASLATTAAAAANVQLPQWDEDWSQVHILNQPGEDAYPIASLTYILVHKELYNSATEMDDEKAYELLKFIEWMVTDGQEYADELHYAPLPETIVQADLELLHLITYKGEQVL